MANDRISQLPVEAAVSPTSGAARTSQELVEAAVSPTSGQARLSQAPAEVIVSPTSGQARTSQVAVEALIQFVNVQDIAPGLIDRTAVAHDPTVSTTGNQFVTLGLLPQPGIAFTPSVGFPGAVELPLIDRTAQAAFITVAAAQEVTLGLINRTAATFTPTVLLAELQVLSLGLLDQTAVAFEPAVLHTEVVNGHTTPIETIVELFYDGVDFIDDVVYSDAAFITQANGIAGTCRVRVKDTPNTRSFTAGKELLLRVNGENAWRGYIATIRRTFAFDAEDRSTPKARFFILDGWDINILFTKRTVFKKSDPINLVGRLYRTNNTPDIQVLQDLFEEFLDLSSDGLNTTKLVENVGVVNIDHPAAPIQPSENWANSMRGIASLTNSIWYIDPDKCVVHTDVDTPNAEWDLSTQPDGVTSIGFRDMELIGDGTGMINDALIWGMALGGSDIVFTREEDATSIAAHGRWQYGELNGSMYKQATVNRRAESIVDGSPLSKRGAKNDKVSVSCTVFNHGFRVAQKVDFTAETFGFNDVIPIRRMDITFATKTDVRYRLYLSHEIDTPWNYFDNYYYNFKMPDLPGFGGWTFPPILPPRICDPADFLLGTHGGQFACIVAEGSPNQNCFSWNQQTGQGDAVFLYGGSTYQARYLADRAGANAMGVFIRHISGAPEASSVDMGKITDGDAIGPSATDTFVAPQDGFYGVGVGTSPYMGYDATGMSVSAEVTFVSGPDPRFEFIDCQDGDPGYAGLGDSQENQSGDGTSVIYTLTGPYVPGSTIVFLGGFFQRPGHEYTESNPAAGEITFTTAPLNAEAIVVFYSATGEEAA